MKAYELVLKGFDGGTSDTDHLIKWVWIVDNLIPKLLELCERISVKMVHEIDLHLSDVGVDAYIETHKELLEFISTCN